MALVNVMVNGRAYTIACDDGEEAHLKELAGEVDAKVRELLGSVGQVSDHRLILMAALLIADERHMAQTQLEILRHQLAEETAVHEDLDGRAEKFENIAAEALENAVKRIEDIAARLKAA